jgi:hypothetical protein
MKYLKLFEQYILISESAVNREECIRKYGRVLFGEQFGESEENTSLENELVRLIKDFTGDKFGERQDPNFAIKLKELSHCLDAYPSVLDPNDKPVYRGTRINLGDIMKCRIEDGIRDVDQKFGLFISSFSYKPRSVVSSWSTLWVKAKQFSSADSMWTNSSISFGGYIFGDPGEKEPFKIDGDILPEVLMKTKIPVVLECKKPNNSFLFNSENFNKLSSSISGEFETLKINNDPIDVKIHFHSVWNEKYKKFVIPASVPYDFSEPEKKVDMGEEIPIFSLENLNTKRLY